ncbi:hypothetical protein V6Z11_A10G079000 [Gossypium hirsutum]
MIHHKGRNLNGSSFGSRLFAQILIFMDDIDFHHPLFLHPSDTPGTIFFSHSFTGVENYTVWSRSLRIALFAKNKLRFVDGGCRVYPESLRAQWDRCNAFVLSWILNTVNPDLSISRINLARWMVPVFSFSIDPLYILLKQQLFQFLMGLNETYATARSQILFMQPLPSVNRAYSMIVQEEAQRSFSSVLSHTPDPIALSSTASRNHKKFIGTCDFCKLKGHKKESCYRLIGFPLDFKFNCKNASQATLAVSSDESPLSPQAVLNPQSAPVFTPQQYSWILELLNKNQAAVAPVVNCAGSEFAYCLPS